MYNALMNPYGQIFKALNDANIRYIVVGGTAMNLLGRPRFTNDIDILLALDSANLGRMRVAMEQMGYERRLPVNIDELGDEKKVLALMKEKGLVAYTFINAKEPLYSIDVIVGESLKFATYEHNRIIVEMWNIPIPVVSVDDLIGMKKSTNREKDASDVAVLLEFKGQ